MMPMRHVTRPRPPQPPPPGAAQVQLPPEGAPQGGPPGGMPGMPPGMPPGMGGPPGMPPGAPPGGPPPVGGPGMDPMSMFRDALLRRMQGGGPPPEAGGMLSTMGGDPSQGMGGPPGMLPGMGQQGAPDQGGDILQQLRQMLATRNSRRVLGGGPATGA